jgi:hypothetical protein
MLLIIGKNNLSNLQQLNILQVHMMYVCEDLKLY